MPNKLRALVCIRPLLNSRRAPAPAFDCAAASSNEHLAPLRSAGALRGDVRARRDAQPRLARISRGAGPSHCGALGGGPSSEALGVSGEASPGPEGLDGARGFGRGRVRPWDPLSRNSVPKRFRRGPAGSSPLMEDWADCRRRSRRGTLSLDAGAPSPLADSRSRRRHGRTAERRSAPPRAPDFLDGAWWRRIGRAGPDGQTAAGELTEFSLELTGFFPLQL